MDTIVQDKTYLILIKVQCNLKKWISTYIKVLAKMVE